MYQKDYILRMIEMLGELIAAILKLVRTGDFQKAEQGIDELYHTLLKKDAAFFQKIPIEKLTTTLIEDHNYTNGHLEILAELFYTEAELREAQKQPAKSLPFYEKSLLLFEFVIKAGKTYSEEKLSKINLISNKIAEIKSVENN
jgi:hypothetical protein